MPELVAKGLKHLIKTRQKADEMPAHSRMLFLQSDFCKRFQKLRWRVLWRARGARMHTNAIFLDIAGFVGALSARTRMKAVSETDYTTPDTRRG